MRAVRVALVGALLSLFPAAILAQTQPSLNAIVQPDGSFKALYEDQPVVTAQFWDFHDGWTRVMDWQSTGNGSTTFSRTGQLNPGTVSASTQFSNSSGGTNLSFQATPTRTLSSDSDHINIMFDEAFWSGATFVAGSQTVVFNPNFTQGFLKTGHVQTITVTRPDGFKLTITAPQSVDFIVQDSRSYHFGFELRFDERKGTWNQGVSKTFAVNLKFSTSITTVPDSQVVINQSSNWVPVLQSMTVQPGSALDWSDKFVTAAGSQGWVKVNSAGKFAFTNSMTTPRRFYGVNLAHWMCFPNQDLVDQIVDSLSRCGYNAVRLHHIDAILTDTTLANSTTIDSARMDKLNYLIYKLKAKGFYVSIDLNSLRVPRANEVITGTITSNDYKALLWVSSAARQNWLTYSTNLLNTMNPYTGLRWKDDPAIAWICLVNENTPFWFPYPRADIKALLDTAVGGNWANMTDDGARKAVDLAKQTSVWMATQLRNIGVKALISNLNAGFNKALSIGRADLDYVDNHMYFAHPGNDDLLPLIQRGTTPFRKIEELGWFAASKIKGKPFTVTEFNAVAPNQFRAEFGLMAGAMGVVQQWDGMWRFQWSDNALSSINVTPLTTLSLTSDPLNMATERAIVAMFLRGDLTNTDTPYTIPNQLSTANEEDCRDVPVVIQTILGKPFQQDITGGSTGGSYVVDGNSLTSNGAVSANLNDLTMRVKTTCSAGVIGSPGQTVNAGPIAAKFTKSRATIYLTSVDRRPLNSSRRMLLAHLTDVQNTGATFRGQERTEITNWGHLPHLAKAGTAEVTVQVQDPKIMRVYRIDLSGRRLSQVTFAKLAGAIKFDVSTTDPNSGSAVFYYEIVTTK